MGRAFNRGLDKDDQKEGLLKRLKNVEDKSEKQFIAINNKTKGIKKWHRMTKGIEWNALINEIDGVEENFNYKKMKTTGSSRTVYDFSVYRTFNELYRDIY